MEHANRWWEDNQRNADRDFPDFPVAPNVKKAAKAVGDVATGTTAAVFIGFGLVALLLGVYLVRQMSPGVHSRRSALDDPCLRRIWQHWN